ncbi:MAG: SpoIIE family protein phosphatase [Bacteroidales bacterium]|nr:SpoIIE family protein phosphatase [Bacteroidales bacterium]
MKHPIAIITSILIIVITGVEPRPASSFNPLNFNSLTTRKKTVFSTDTIKPIRTNIGNPFITNYNSNLLDQQIWSICQDEYGQMIFAHRQGLIIFNGTSWEQLKLPAIPFVLKSLPDKHLILVGCDNQFGYIKLNHNGNYEYFELSDKNSDPGEISEIKLSDTKIYFYSDETISIFDRSTLLFESSVKVEKGERQNGIFLFHNEIYISYKGKGLFKISSDGTKEYLKNSKTISSQQIAFSLALTENKLLIGTYSNKLFTFNGKAISEYESKANKYIEESQLVGGINLNKDQYALSTILGGTIILNKNNGELVDIINYQTGLPDDEIFSAGIDSHGGLWLSHGFGISRVNYNLPVKDFNYYPGIEGKLIDVIEFENTSYVATTEGVFYLDTIADIKEYEIFIKKQRIKNIEQTKTNQVNNIQEQPEKKNFLQRWKEKRKKRKLQKNDTSIKTDSINEPETSEAVIKNNSVSKKYYYSKETVRVLSLSYVFKKVPDISAKCKQLVKYKDFLLVASNSGLYTITNKKSQKILENIYVNIISPSANDGLFYIGFDNGITAIKYEGKHWREYSDIQPEGFEDVVYSVAEDKNQNLWIGIDGIIYYFKTDEKQQTTSFEIYDLEKEYPDKFSIRQIENKVFFLSAGQIYQFNSETEKIEISREISPNQLPYSKFIISQSDVAWFKYGDNWQYVSNKYQISKEHVALLNLFENIQNIRVDQKENIWIVDGKNNLYKILPEDVSKLLLTDFKVYIKNIETDQGILINPKKIEIDQEVDVLNFKISAPYYLRPDGLRYQYYIEGAMNGWSEWRQSQDFDFLLQPGEYKVQIKAKNIFGYTSESVSYPFKVKDPIWMNPWFIAIMAAVVILLVSLIIYLLQRKKERRLQRDNKILELKVAERTFEIKKQKEQIEYKNREITDSLNYASQIQSAILPPKKMLNEAVSESFVLNKPKDIVSGDYFWANRINGQLVVTAADCTGHGVPGAFLSMLGVTFLNEITNKMEYLRANLILEKLRSRVIKSLHQEGYDQKRFDGIDLSLVVIDLKELKMQFAGANNPMYIIRNGMLTEFKGNRMPIGMHSYDNKPFTNHEIELKKGDIVYLFSDGYTDQFGGEYGRKFLTRNFKILLTEISKLPMNKQNNILEETFIAWKGKYEQIDDILVIGLKI